MMFLLFHGNFVLLDMKSTATSMTCLGGETGIRYKVERILATSEISVANSVQFLDFSSLLAASIHSSVSSSVPSVFFVANPIYFPFLLWFFLVRPFIRYGEFFHKVKNNNKYNIL
jgi:hypothetical protein